MGFLSKVLGDAQAAFTQYKGDTVLLKAFCAGAANVTAADGVVEDAEVDTALSGLLANEGLKVAFTHAELEAAFTAALNNSKTRLGKMENLRAIQAIANRPADQKQNVFLVAADVADNGGIGDAERKVLDVIAKELGLDAAKLLGS